MRPFLLKGHERPLTRVKYNREGDLLFTTAMDKSPAVWRAVNGERLGTYKGHNGAVRDIDITYNTERVITGSADNSAVLWNAATGEKLHTWEFKAPIRCVAFSPGDDFIAITTAKLMGQSANVYIFEHDFDSNAQQEDWITSLEGHEGTIVRVLWYPTSDKIITASEDKTVRIWDSESGEELHQFVAHKDHLTDCQFSPDYSMFITSSKDQTSKLWSSHDYELLKTYKVEHPVNSASVSPLFSHILLGGGQEASKVTTTANREGNFEGKFFHLVYEEQLARVKGHFGPINTVTFSPDGKQFVSGGEDGFVRLHTFDEDYFVKSAENTV